MQGPSMKGHFLSKFGGWFLRIEITSFYRKSPGFIDRRLKSVTFVKIAFNFPDGLDLLLGKSPVGSDAGYNSSSFRDVALGLPVSDLFLAGACQIGSVADAKGFGVLMIHHMKFPPKRFIEGKKLGPSMYTEVSLFLGRIDEKLERERHIERIGV
jgi:hypothetical protein